MTVERMAGVRPLLAVLVVGLVIMQLVDFTLTVLALEMGASEGNPLISSVNGWVLAWKLTFACLLGVVLIRPKPWYVWGVGGVAVVYVVIVVYSCIGLLVAL